MSRPSLIRCLLIALLVHGVAVWLLSISAQPTLNAPSLASKSPSCGDGAWMLEVIHDERVRQVSSTSMNKAVVRSRTVQGGERASSPLVREPEATDAPVHVRPRSGALQQEPIAAIDAFANDNLALQDAAPQKNVLVGRLSLQDMGIGQSSALVVGEELRSFADESSIQNRLDKELAKGVLGSDALLNSALDGALRRVVEGVARAVLVKPSHALLKIQLGTEGELVEVTLLEGAQESAEWRALTARLRGQRIPRFAEHRSLAFTFHVTNGPRLPSGRSPRTRLSVGGVQTNAGGAADSPHVEVLPPRIRLAKPLVLDSAASGGTTTQADGPAYVELGILDADFDPVDIAGNEQHAVQVRLVRREVL